MQFKANIIAYPEYSAQDTVIRKTKPPTAM